MQSPDFVEVYDAALEAAKCRALITRFETSGHPRRGETGGGIETSLKNSWDIPLHLHPEWADAQQMLNDAVFPAFKRYLRSYAHAALAPLRLQIKDPTTGAMSTLDAERLAALDEATLDSIVMMVFRPGTINLQKYVADQGGYPYWHCEQYPMLDQGEALHRAVLWTLYLNDDFSAGETEFLYQRRMVVPRTGSLLIAPTAFTHTHRGNMPKGGNKYIATSWILYQRAEVLHGAQRR
jgi:2-oxoglutarate-Fe(II)-dependent oxygenase superfamily protein